MGKVPETLEDIRNFVHGEGRFSNDPRINVLHGRTVENHFSHDDENIDATFDQYGFNEDEINWDILEGRGGFNERTVDDFLTAASDQLFGGRSLKEYFESRGAVRLIYLFTEYIPEHSDEDINDVLVSAGVSVEELQLLDNMLTASDKFVEFLTAYFPLMQTVVDNYRLYKPKMMQETLDEMGTADPLEYTFEKMMEAFSGDSKTFTWVGAKNFKDTHELIENALIDKGWDKMPNNPPKNILPWEMRIGASKFAVPPININVHQSFKSGSLSGGAIRQRNTPKFNSGYSETLIDITLYFPNQESVWGFEGDSFSIDLLKDDISEEVVDKYLSSLRGLVTQFKYAPFLPIKNQYLNQVYDITAVALHSMTVSTVENFPFCLAVNLSMQKFNHKVFQPTVRDFNTAVHWGRFRHYMMAAAQNINRVVGRGFLRREITRGSSGEDYNEQISYEHDEPIRFNKTTDWAQGRHFELYFPERTPARVFMPDLNAFRAVGEDMYAADNQSGWSGFLANLGYSPTDKDPVYDALKNMTQQADQGSMPTGDPKLLADFLVEKEISDDMKHDLLQGFVDYYVQLMTDKNLQDVAADLVQLRTEEAKELWFMELFNKYQKQYKVREQQQKRKEASSEIIIKEWQVPMKKYKMDWDKVFITGITTTIGNNFAKLQLQMEEDPVLQHIGGMDSQINVNMVVFGESELIKWKRMFTHVNGLAMLEHAHGVLGFFGIKNLITALCGIKYALPLDFSVETIPGFPNVYNVSMSFVDFDVEQQKREELSNDQQRMLTEQFSKRNPFLRIKQMWGAFNAYPDFPLSVTDDAGNIIGHLDPDYYFRAFDTWDDDLLKHGNKGPRRSVDVDAELEEVNDYFRGLPVFVKNEVRGHIDETRERLYQERDISRYFEIQDKLENFKSLFGSRAQAEQDRIKKNLTDERNAIITRLGNRIPTVAGYNIDKEGITGTTKGYGDEHKVRWSFGVYGEEQKDVGVVEIKGNNINLGSLNKDTKKYSPMTEGIGIADSNADQFVKSSFTEGLTPLSDYQNAYLEGSSSFVDQYEQIAYDARYRDVSGRMIRAFPTYMLWLIDEGGRYAGVKLFDNFYGLQSVIDFSIVQSEDILGDTLVLRLSNLYKKLTTPANEFNIFADQGEEEKSGYAAIDTIYSDVPRNINSGMYDNYLVDLNNVRLKPGVRLHLRMGYGSNPNALQTVFNGTVTSVAAGEIMEVVAQSDAIELSAIINTTNEKGHSGKIDGAMFTGMWLSEPRDLMIRLLTMGSSAVKEAMAAGTEGKIFSENKWGIRHFGTILYESMTPEEVARQEKLSNTVATATGESSPLDEDMPPMVDADKLPGDTPDGNGGDVGDVLKGSYAVLRKGAIGAITGLYRGLETKRDYEVFKRNIYPGNGTGIAQYLGADSLNGGDIMAASNSHPNVAVMGGQIIDPNADSRQTETATGGENGDISFNLTPLERIRDQQLTNSAFATSALHGYEVSGVSTDQLRAYQKGMKRDHAVLAFMGLDRGEDEDTDGYDEVSFRAATYMKSVWDMFQTCAALLPNYVVAVRPFEDRSTVFYGKPHWLYTSGVIPLSTGVPNDGTKGPKMLGRDKELEEILQKLGDIANSLADSKEQIDMIDNAVIKQYESATGIPGGGTYTGGAGTQELKVTYNNKEYVLKFPNYDASSDKNKLGVEMHLPTEGTHKQREDLPDSVKYPFYMDRKGGGRGGRTKIYKYGTADTVLGEDANLPGESGAFGFLDPDMEMYYINFLWDWKQAPPGALKYQKVLVVSKETGMACVCAVGERGPAQDVTNATGKVAGASPDVHMAIGNVDFKDGVPCEFSWLPFDAPVGPTTGSIANADAGTTTAPSGPANPTQADAAAAKAAKPVDPTKRDPINVTIPTIERNEDAYEHYMFGWRELRNPWDNPWGSEYGSPDIEDYVNMAGDPWTKASIDRIKEKGLSLGDTPFGPDPVSIAARRYYDSEYNERVSEIEQLHIDLEVPGVVNGKEHYALETNFLDSSGSPLTEGRGKQAAENIWDQFRRIWLDAPHSDDPDGTTGRSFRDYRDEFKDDRGKLSSDYLPELKRPELVKIFEDMRAIGVVTGAKGGNHVPFGYFAKDEDFVFDKDLKDEYISAGTAKNEADFKLKYNRSMMFIYRTIEEFVAFLWKNPYARAWLVITTSGDKGLDLLMADSNDNYDFGQSEVTQAFRYYITVRGNGEPSVEATPKPTTGMNDVQLKMMTYLTTHNRKGADVGGIDTILRGVADSLGKNIKRLWEAVSIGFSGMFSLFEQALGSYGEAFERAMAMQRRANILNAAYNDSLYYAAGAPGTLARMADNPFTREYGEPVVEIREPFQRLHYINSFQHIISNNIQENLDGVYTTITVTSDGNYPITVFFDKGAPPERQVEGFVESGLYWDNAKGTGFFAFMHPFLNPIETARGVSKINFGSSDELSSKRVGIYHLKESLKDIYQGEVITLGNADIRPWDLVYIGDVYQRMYGMFEVEQVVHHFTPETGFITSITPNALAIANDPGRWAALSWLDSWMGVKNVRDDVRNLLITRSTESSPVARGELTLNDLLTNLEPQIRGQVQYTHGSSAMMKDLAGHFASGLAYKSEDFGEEDATVQTGRSVTSELLFSNIPVAGLVYNKVWGLWDWVKNNLADQQDCYISYLTKDGQPMDGGLSYNSGVAVGSHHSFKLLPGLLGFEFDVSKDGHRRITIEDLLSKLGYNERDVISIRRNTSLWVSRLNAQILKTAGSGPDMLGLGDFEVLTGTVTEISDGDTITVETQKGSIRYRLSGINTAELSYYVSDGASFEAIPMTDPGRQAVEYLMSVLPVGSVVAIRTNPTGASTYDRIPSVIFHNVPVGTPPNMKEELLRSYAEAGSSDSPMGFIPWDAYLDDGRPHTINWEMIMAGHSPTNTSVYPTSTTQRGGGASPINSVN